MKTGGGCVTEAVGRAERARESRKGGEHSIGIRPVWTADGGSCTGGGRVG